MAGDSGDGLQSFVWMTEGGLMWGRMLMARGNEGGVGIWPVGCGGCQRQPSDINRHSVADMFLRAIEGLSY